MPKIVQVQVDVESGGVEVAVDRTETLIRQLRDLKYSQQQLDVSTREGAAAFAELNVKILELNEQLEVNKVRNKSLFDQVGMLGGTFGETGAKIGETVSSLRILSAFRLEDLTSGLTFVGSTLSRIAKGFGEVTGITKVYTVLNEALASSFVSVGVGEEAAAVGAQTFAAALTATGIGAIIVLIGAAVYALKEYFDSEEKATRALEEFNSALEYQKHLLEVDTTALEVSNKAAVTRAKIAGASEKEITEIEQKGYEERLKLLRANDEKINEARSELAKNTVISAKDRVKAQQDLDKQYQESNAAIIKLITDNEQKGLDERLKNADKARATAKAAATALNNYIAQSHAATQSARDLELEKEDENFKKLTKDFQGNAKLMEAANEAHRVNKAAINKKYDDKATDEAYKAWQNEIDGEEKNAKEDEKLLLAQLEDKHAKGLISEQEYLDEVLKIKKDYAFTELDKLKAETDYTKATAKLTDDRIKKADEEAKTEKERAKIIAQSWIDLGSSVGKTFSDLSNVFEKGSDLAKTFAIISVVINAAASIGKIRLSAMEASADFIKAQSAATAAGIEGGILMADPFTFALGAAEVAAAEAGFTAASAGLGLVKGNEALQIASVGITSGAQIAAILSANASSGTSSAGGSSGQAATPSFNGTVSVGPPVIGASAASSTGNLGSIVGNAVQSGNSTSRPIQAFVVGTSVTTQQQLDRRVALAAQMGG